MPVGSGTGDGAKAPALLPGELVDLVCTSGRPFMLIDVRVVRLPEEEEEEDGVAAALQRPGPEEKYSDVMPGSGEVGEVWCRGPTVFSGMRLFRSSHFIPLCVQEMVL